MKERHSSETSGTLGVKDVERLLDAATELGINYIDMKERHSSETSGRSARINSSKESCRKAHPQRNISLAALYRGDRHVFRAGPDG